jgi:trimeric autotransporter adhesin
LTITRCEGVSGMCAPRLCLAVFPQALLQVIGGVYSRGAARRVAAKARRQFPPVAGITNHVGWVLAVWLGCGILAVAAPPVAVPDTYESLWNAVLYVGAPGLPEVLANDSDADGDQLIAVKVTDPAHGTVIFHDDGRFDYTPDEDYVGTDTFTYKANDAVADSNVATVAIKVRARDWFALGEGVGSPVSALACGAPGNLYVGGSFTTAGGGAANRIARWDGSNWHTLGVGVGDQVRALVWDGAATLYVGGSFTTAGGVAANHVAKWDGTNWHALGAGVNGGVRALALDASGALYVGGSFTSAGGVVANGVARWDGAAWSALGAGTDDEVQALAVDASGDLYVGGSFSSAGGVATNSIAKWNGTSWSGLGTGMVGGGVSGLALDASGILYACGEFVTAGGADALHIARWDGTAWSALCPPASELPGRHFHALASDAVGNVYAGGLFPDGPIRNAARWDGTRWLLLGSGLGDDVQALAVDAAGGLFAGGQFTTAGGNPANHVARYDVPTPPVAVADTYDTNRDMALDITAPGMLANDSGANGEVLTAAKVTDPAHGTLALNANGSFTYTPDAGYAGPDSFTYKANDGVDDSGVATVTITVWDGSWDALGAEIDGTVYALAHDALGNLYAGGDFSSVRRAAANHIAKWDGTTWSALGDGMDGPVFSLALDGTGTLYAAGDFTLAGGVAVNHVAKWDGTAWSALGTGTDGHVNALAHDGAGNLYVGGDFTTAGGVAASCIAKWDGTGWSSLGSGMDNWVWALSFDAAGDLYVGGSFTTAGGIDARCVARWDGTGWSSLGTGLEARAWSLALDASGNLYVGGEFSTPDGAGAHRVARWDGSEWSYLGAEMNGEAYALAFGGSGDLYVGGSFTAAGGVAASRIARWDGTAWRALGTGMDGCVWALASDASGDLYAGGDFSTAAGVAVNRVAKHDIPSPPEAMADSCEAFRNTELVVTAPGLLGNDLDLDGDALVAVKVTDPTHGTFLAFNADGSFTYMPANDYVGLDSFTYKANDGVYDSAVVTVSIVVWNGRWSALGSEVDGSVSALVFDAMGDLFAGGSFTTAGGVVANRIAKWDGTNWSALGTGMDGSVLTLAFSGSGDLYAGGSFTTAGGVAASGIAKWDGNTWSALGTGVAGTFGTLAFDGVGNLYAGGWFTTAGGGVANGIAKWDGTSWSALGTGMTGGTGVGALAFDSLGNLYAGGFFTAAGGVAANHLAVWDGSSWSALEPEVGNLVNALAFDASGNLYAGLCGGIGGVSGVRKWDGTVWSTLVDGRSGARDAPITRGTWALAFDASGDLHASDAFTVNHWDGSEWSKLGSGMDAPVRALVFDASGTLFASGDFTVAGGVAANYIAKWETFQPPVATADAYDAAWGTPTPVAAPGVLANDSDPNGDPLTAVLVTGPGHGELVFPGDGSFVYTGIGDYTGEDTFTYKAFDGMDYSSEVTVTVTVTNDAPVAIDDTYEALRNVVLYVGGHGTLEVLANDSDADGDQLVAVKVADPAHGTVIVHDDGAFNYTPDQDYVGTDTFTYKANDAVEDSNVATVTIKVRACDWSALGAGVGSPVSALACGASGDLYVGGSFTTAGGGTANRIARWGGNDWHALGLGVNDQVRALAWDGAGTLYVGGSFTTAGGVAANHVAKWNGTSWHALGAGVNGGVRALALDASGALYVGGSFSSAGGVAANGVAKWDGAAWSALGAGTDDEVQALAVGASGELYVGGSFSSAGGVAANTIAKWNGTSWVGLGTGMAGGGVSGLALDASGMLYACGDFVVAGGVDALHIAKWDGTAWSALGQGDAELVGQVFHTVACDTGGNLYAGGWFPDVVINHVARWNGTKWSPVGSGVGDHVQALAVDAAGDLYAGGQFTTAGGFGPNGFNTPGNPANHVAKYDIPSPPVAVPDTYDANWNTALNVAAPGVLANDSDADGEALTAVKVTDPDHGTLALNADGSFTYTPDAGFVGTDSFTYQAKDGVDDSAVTTVTITVLQTYRLTVIGGSGQGSYPAGVGVLVTTGDPPAGLVFAGWTADPGEYAANLANPNAESTTFTMPANAVTLDFTYRPPENKLDVIPVALAAASATDKSAARPTGLSGVTVGDTFVVELWAKNRDGSTKWLTVGGADLSYDTALLDAEAGGLYHGATYNTLTQGTVDDATGLVDEFGGGVAVGFEDPELGTTHWARIGGATFVATAAGDAAVTPAAATTFQWFRKDAGGTEAVAWADVPLEGINVKIAADPRTPDLSGDGLCNLTDYGYFLGCYGEASGDAGWLPYGPMCDYNRDDVVNLIDYGYFLGFYGKPSEQWQMPVIGRDGEREIRLEVVAVAVSAAGALDKATVLPTRLDSVAVADTFVVELWVKNADASPSWISVGGVDVGYTTSAVDVDALHHGGVYAALPQGTIDDASGLVDEFGGGVAAGTTDTELGSSHWARLGHFQVTATAVGTVQFTPSAATTAQFFRNDPFAAIGWSEVQFTGASLTVTPATHSVTFCPGAHGTIPAANSGADYVVTVADGGAVPASPAIAAVVGWQLASWDWLPTRRGEEPSTITQDWTATALYEDATPDWSADLVLTGLAPATLTFGMRSDATDGWDAGVDVQYPLPAAGQACLASDDLALSYSTDLRAPARTAEFLLIASAAIDTAATVAWDVPALPDDAYLTIYEVLLDGVTPSREPVARELVGCTALNMALVQSLDIPAGETRCYVIRYGDDLVFDLSFLRGWNLVSLPIEPVSPALDLVLDDGQSRAADGAEMRDGLRGAIHSGSVWTWAGQGYVAVTEMHACVGYWVYAPEPVVILVNGTPGNQVAFDLKRGWNQCGVEVVCLMPNDPRIIGTPWGWRPLALRYEPVGVFCPGLGYWLNASEDAIVPLPARSGE